MIIVRFEHKETGRLFTMPTDRFLNDTRQLVTDIGMMHSTPGSDWDCGMRDFFDIPDKSKVKFAFTRHAFMNVEFAKLLVDLSRQPDIRMRVIANPEIVWVSASGIQCCFLDTACA